MAISAHDGNWGLDCWISEEAYKSDEDSREEYAASEREALERIVKLLAAGRYKFIVLSKWNYSASDWDEIDEFTPDSPPDLE